MCCHSGITSRTSRNLGGWHTLGGARTFGSVLDYTALWLHCVFAATAGLAGVGCCSLGVTDWCATNVEV